MRSGEQVDNAEVQPLGDIGTHCHPFLGLRDSFMNSAGRSSVHGQQALKDSMGSSDIQNLRLTH